MADNYQTEISVREFLPEIKAAQATAIMAAVKSSIYFNLCISASAVLIAVVVNGPSASMFVWLAIAHTILALRLSFQRGMDARFVAAGRADTALRVLSYGSFASGMAWAALPFFIMDFNGGGKDAFLLLIMVGIAAGGVIRHIAYSPVALTFAMPPMMSIVLTLAVEGSSASTILALNVVGLLVVLYKSSVAGEATFANNELGKLRATRLANSLREANVDIMQKNARLEVLANCDPLTGLSNRALFSSRLREHIASADAFGQEVALLIIDLDRFKSINDTLGHSAGDSVLVQTSARLRAVIGSKGEIARLGGDEFAIIVTGTDAARTARLAARDILKKTKAPLTVGGGAFVIGTSIGLAAFPQHAETAEELLACADMALYEAKERGRRRLQEFNPRLKSQADRQRQIELDLEEAIRTGSVEAWFQPQVLLNNREIVGFEALVRWTHPRLGYITPPEIVQAAQVMHITDKLTAHIAAAACRLLNRLPELGLPEATVAINVSPREFSFYSLADVLGLVTKQHGINPALLEIEITEEAIIDTSIVGNELKRLEEAGYKLAVDDFGMGHSSLAYLISLKIDRLKIDRSFVEGVANSRHNQALIAALIGIGHTLQIDIVVEGVEHEEDVEVLRVLGCRIGQGYLYARPMSPDKLDGWIDAHRQTITARAVA
ncbi:MAG: GGDEF-domain containing protein [Rhizobium sp. 63-7]|nr:MAG: GGDEF-domain containing protein [Rhizobium sp. 63-7]